MDGLQGRKRTREGDVAHTEKIASMTFVSEIKQHTDDISTSSSLDFPRIALLMSSMNCSSDRYACPTKLQCQGHKKGFNSGTHIPEEDNIPFTGFIKRIGCSRTAEQGGCRCGPGTVPIVARARTDDSKKRRWCSSVNILRDRIPDPGTRLGTCEVAMEKLKNGFFFHAVSQSHSNYIILCAE